MEQSLKYFDLSNRYLIRHFNDAITQLAIDIALGQTIDYKTIEEYNSIWRDFKTATILLYENMDNDKPKLAMMPSYFGHGLTSELVTVEIAYGIGRSVL